MCSISFSIKFHIPTRVLYSEILCRLLMSPKTNYSLVAVTLRGKQNYISCNGRLVETRRVLVYNVHDTCKHRDRNMQTEGREHKVT